MATPSPRSPLAPFRAPSSRTLRLIPSAYPGQLSAEARGSALLSSGASDTSFRALCASLVVAQQSPAAQNNSADECASTALASSSCGLAEVTWKQQTTRASPRCTIHIETR